MSLEEVEQKMNEFGKGNVQCGFEIEADFKWVS